MKRIALVGLGAVGGFGLALGVLTAAHGANDVNTYNQLSLFSDAFERVGERLVDLAARRDPRIGVVPKPKKKRKRTTVVRRGRR